MVVIYVSVPLVLELLFIGVAGYILYKKKLTVVRIARVEMPSRRGKRIPNVPQTLPVIVEDIEPENSLEKSSVSMQGFSEFNKDGRHIKSHTSSASSFFS